MKQEARTRTILNRILVAGFFCAVVGCAQQPAVSPQISLQPAGFKDLVGWQDDQLDKALATFRKSCDVLLRQATKTEANQPQAGASHVNWRLACEAAATVNAKDNKAARDYFEKWFSPFAVIDRDGKPEGLITGYYEPELRGARRAAGPYQFPLYARPTDLVVADLGKFDTSLAGRRITGRVLNGAFVPYADRRSIENDNLVPKPAPLVWVDNKVDAFFLHIQGSGRVKLSDGGLMRLGFAASNGRPYTAIGRTLIRRGAISKDKVSMQSIRAWLAANPNKAAEIMAQNARYIFFRELKGNAPVGAQGVELTAGRSLAVDRRAIPLGAPLWLATQDPIDPHQSYRRLMIAQDVGHAIKGGIRGDIFFGHGQLAARRAGLMKQPGRYFILLPKAASPAS